MVPKTSMEVPERWYAAPHTLFLWIALVFGAANLVFNPPFMGSQAYFAIDAPLRLVFGAMQKNLSAEVAELSGGEAGSFDNKNDLDRVLDRVSSHIRNSYILTFQPTSTEPGLHTIRVQLTHHPEMMVSARTGPDERSWIRARLPLCA